MKASSFLSPLILEALDDGNFMVKESFRYHVGDISNKIIIEVPAGFITDFSSVPSFLNFIVPKLGRYNSASVIHDLLYQLVREGKFNRAIADAIFLEAMEVSGVRFSQRWLMYICLRLVGWVAVRQKGFQPEKP